MHKIQARMILEVLGRPKENVALGLDALIKKLGGEPAIKVIGSDMHDPLPVKESKDLFTAFAEVTIEADSLPNFFAILFAYMPANVDIIKPEHVTFDNTDVNHIANILIQRLHNYDAVAKKVMNDKEILVKKLYEVAPHLFKKQSPIQGQESSKEEKKSVKKQTKKKKR